MLLHIYHDQFFILFFNFILIPKHYFLYKNNNTAPQQNIGTKTSSKLNKIVT